MTAATPAPWFQLRFALASAAVELDGEGGVRAYIEAHPDMVGLTAAICEAARRQFGPDASLLLRLYRDPEVEDAYLVLSVRLNQYGPDTLSRIRSVSDGFDSDLCNASGSILVTTDFRPLR